MDQTLESNTGSLEPSFYTLVIMIDMQLRSFDGFETLLMCRFVGGELNTCYNAIDRHVEKGRGQRTALIYDSPVAGRDSTEPLVRYISYNELLNEVSPI